MIVKRFADSLRRQDWASVLVELLIVVVGIVLGLQITQWWEDRERAEVRAEALLRLHDEAVRAVTYHREMVEQVLQTTNEARTEAITRLLSGDWEGADTSFLTRGVVTIGLLPSPSPPRSVYDELIASGLYAELGDATLRRAISDYYARLTFLRGQVDYIRQTARDRRVDHSHPAIEARFDPESARQRKWVVDFEALAQDSDTVEAIVAGNNGQRAITGWWESVLEHAEAMCEALAGETGRPCEPPSGS